MDNLIVKLNNSETKNAGEYWSFCFDGKPIVIVAPCINYRKNLTGILVGDSPETEGEIHLVSLVVTEELSELDQEKRTKFFNAMNSKFKLLGYRMRYFSTNGIHVQRLDENRIGFSINNTQFMEFYDLSSSIPRTGDMTQMLSVEYRGKEYVVSSDLFNIDLVDYEASLEYPLSFAMSFAPHAHGLK